MGKRKVGILGGSFNPVHQAHLVMAEQVGQKLQLDAVYLMPSFSPPHVDRKTTIDASIRLAMLDLAIANNPLLAIETCELTRGGKSYTFDTMQHLVATNPDVEYYFIIGGDMVEYLPKWYNIDSLIDMVQFVGVNRPGHATDSPYPVKWVDVPAMDISSTYIRQAVQQQQSIRYLVPETVRAYIETEGLYRDGI